jgi:hypothetical protein
MWTVYDYSYRYKEKFDKLIIITNATILPCKEDVSVFQKYGKNMQIQISDYGKLSYKRREMTSMLTDKNIPFVVKRYHGDIQHYGGWINNNSFSESGKTEEELTRQHEQCGLVEMRNFHLYRGKFHGCARSLMASELGKVIPARRDYVDLNDEQMGTTEKREIIRHFNDFPRVSCRSCAGFGDFVKRYPAAEQVSD